MTARPCKGTGIPARSLPLIILAAVLIMIPASAGSEPDGPALQNVTAPQQVWIGVYIMDLNNFNVADGTFVTNFYMTLESDSPVSIADLDFVNGHATSVDTLLDSPNEKSYRIFAQMTADPDLRLYPFDRHTLPIEIEPKLYDESRMVLLIRRNSTGLEPGTDLAGWRLIGETAVITSKTYPQSVTPCSRAAFRYDIRRDTTSTILKFFLPILLLLVISLSSLVMKGSSRLGLDASMFIVAVFIHWRISDAVPLVAYATFLDIFMIITYATIAMVLISGILIQKFAESNDSARAETVNLWSVRIIPVVSITAYVLLFLALLA
ncbi:MAG: hypothetical protein LUQ25_06165 [Methanoregulaceae archaeon]|nr:hypothetical protein [Methanoregulaceae archaeon]